jgi:hypothetical protein
MQPENVSFDYLNSLVKQFRYYRSLGEKAMSQLSDGQLSWQFNDESNSIAIIVNHLGGNMRSRFTDFLTSDGEKPWRNRDHEFVDRFASRAEIFECWNEGWDLLLQAIDSLREEDLAKLVYIRNEGHTVIEALNRQLAHYSYHVGQIVFIAKMLADKNWQTLSIARNRSGDYNAIKFERDKSRRHFTDDELS